MACLSCGTVEGFVNNAPTAADYLPTQQLLIPGAPAPQTLHLLQPQQEAEGAFVPFMKSECSFASQTCIYTAQGQVVCPKGGVGACGPAKQ